MFQLRSRTVILEEVTSDLSKSDVPIMSEFGRIAEVFTKFSVKQRSTNPGSKLD
ncbi:hypothetical protein M758_UG164100 [Ceratodon purpureus]|nr:hypothetical protein M758_UG164100 [Ceratodon purpureus]